MELELEDTLLRDEDQPSEQTSKNASPVLKRKNDKSREEKGETMAKDDRDYDESIVSLMRNYNSKLSGEDDTSQPTSRAAPIVTSEPTRKKKKRKRSQISICLTNCRYESIRRVSSAFGMREVSEEDAWNFYWTDMSVSVERAKEMKRFQRINHFPGMLEICRKDLLARNLNRMQKIYPKEYNFFPKTWCLPAEFATSRYADPNVNNTTNVFMHLTNYALNKHSRTYVYDSEAGSKRKISTLNKILLSQGVDLDALWHSIDQVIVKTVISAWPILKHSYHACFPSHDMVHACFEILGFDILLDHKLHPFILEVNHSPSFHTDTQLDREVKEGLLTDTFTMLNIWQCDKRRVLEEDRRRIRDRLLQTNKFSEVVSGEEKEPEKTPWQTQIQWEETHLGNFRRVYPVGEQYACLFQQPSGSLYTGTASSRARGDCTRLQREEFQQTKAKAEALLKTKPPGKPAKDNEKRAPDEASVASTSEKTAKSKKTEGVAKKMENRKLSGKPSPSILPTVEEKEVKPTYVLCSFEPDPIVEKEERERVNQLAQRDFLIRSYGMLEQIYLVMKKMGTLRPEDERKYGVYGRLSIVSNSPKPAILEKTDTQTHKAGRQGPFRRRTGRELPSGRDGGAGRVKSSHHTATIISNADIISHRNVCAPS
ncbi:tubulin polyglutamylase TTLL13-like isoform X4 [Leguminivora glycinivorella]|uniref:tubulin polyglutamylase TTLL13-like isoform X4 n=1 Tax=Leguminivora glycinivorella TaxID=1035111 RepID=UPI002010BF16|nr:tubulin polyglutamylase TTLL13-like isoform X4 [Leguminivora glycinivorella]